MGRRQEHIYFARIILVKFNCIVLSAISKSFRCAKTQITSLKMNSKGCKEEGLSQLAVVTQTNSIHLVQIKKIEFL